MPDPAAPPADPKPGDPPKDPPKAEPPKSDPPADPPKQPDPQPPKSEPSLDDLPPHLQQVVRNARRVEGEAKARAEAAEAKIQEAERAKLSEQERIQAERDDAKAAADKARREANEARLQVKLSRTTIKRTVKDDKGEDTEIEVKVADPELAADALLKRGVSFTDSGEIENFDDQVRDLLDERPVLAATQGERPEPPKPPKANGGAGGSGGETPPQLTADQVAAANKAGKTPEEWAELSKVKTAADFDKVVAARQPAKSD